ncbi:MAG: DNA-directed RNA polymerase subunit beta' [Parcubacteria group bacterium GW2011_GWA1_45_7]|nr:MAG: DNA-directed RNA polymerase subunit beta' [Parcubacteria group bacterium GW2011_GWA1_45_7]
MKQKPDIQSKKHEERKPSMMGVYDFDALKLMLASSDEILSWSYGEVLKPETINYRTQRPEKDGLFSERIFGPTKDYECVRWRGVVCDRCGVEVTNSIVRRERMGHITLAASCVHIWFLRSIPSRIGLLLDIPVNQVEKVVYYTGYIITNVDAKARAGVLKELDQEYATKVKQIKAAKKGDPRKQDISNLDASFKKAKEEVTGLAALKVISEVEYQYLAMRYGHMFDAQTGSEPIIELLKRIDLKKLYDELSVQYAKTKVFNKKIFQRLRAVRSLLNNNIRPESMFFSVLPVLPPDLRPMVQLDGGRFASSDLNDLYRRIINRNNRLKKLIELSSPEVIIRNEKRMLQEAVDALIDNSARRSQGMKSMAMTLTRRPLRSLADILKGKTGRFRQNLLGKRVDYSGRSVIVVGPELKLYECGIPKVMALEIFKPFVVHELVARELAHNMKAAAKMIDDQDEQVWQILEEVIQDKYVLLNRAPTLHRISVQAFKPILIGGLSIQIPPMVCSAFNADFDGDMMAIHLPLSEEAQRESREIMLSSLNLLKPSAGIPITEPTKDMRLGLYWLTAVPVETETPQAFGSPAEALYAYEVGMVGLRDQIKIQIDPALPRFAGIKDPYLVTSVGRVIFNNILPAELPFVNSVINKGLARKVIADFISLLGVERSYEILDSMKSLGFLYATKSGISWGMDDLVTPPEKYAIIAEAKLKITQNNNQFAQGFVSEAERKQKAINIWQAVEKTLAETTVKHLDQNSPAVIIMKSDASKANQLTLKQMATMKGLVTDPSGGIVEIPVESSYKEGLNSLEYFTSLHGSRKGLVDTALRTSEAGYLTRRLVDVAQDMVIIEEDCKDAVGRVILSCQTRFGICRTCYGYDLGYNNMVRMGTAVGIVAAQSIGEPGTQLTLRTFHGGGAAVSDITQGLPRVEEVLELHPPKGKGALARHAGIIAEIEEIGNEKIIKIQPTKDRKAKTGRRSKLGSTLDEYPISINLDTLIKEGDKVEAGQRLSEGSLDIKDILMTLGKRAAEEYMIQEIKKIYNLQGADINDKHLEVIARQMFSLVRVVESGDSEYLRGEILHRSRFFALNETLKAQKKKPARAIQLVVGVSNVALAAEGFLAAASFQNVVRILTEAAIDGRVDSLRGLKENVIIGKLIPAGTGLDKEPVEVLGVAE